MQDYGGQAGAFLVRQMQFELVFEIVAPCLVRSVGFLWATHRA